MAAQAEQLSMLEESQREELDLLKAARKAALGRHHGYAG